MKDYEKDEVLYSAPINYAARLDLPVKIPAAEREATEEQLRDDLVAAVDAGKLTIFSIDVEAVAEDDIEDDQKLNWYCGLAASFILSSFYCRADDFDGYELIAHDPSMIAAPEERIDQ